MVKRKGWPRYKVAECDSPFRSRRSEDRDSHVLFQGMLERMGAEATKMLREVLDAHPWDREPDQRDTVH